MLIPQHPIRYLEEEEVLLVGLPLVVVAETHRPRWILPHCPTRINIINNVDEVQVVSIIEYNIALVPTATRWNGNVRRVLMYVLVIIILRLLLQWHY